MEVYTPSLRQPLPPPLPRPSPCPALHLARPGSVASVRVWCRCRASWRSPIPSPTQSPLHPTPHPPHHLARPFSVASARLWCSFQPLHPPLHLPSPLQRGFSARVVQVPSGMETFCTRLWTRPFPPPLPHFTHPFTLHPSPCTPPPCMPLQCGFSARVVQVLSAMEVPFESVNILEVRVVGGCLFTGSSRAATCMTGREGTCCICRGAAAGCCCLRLRSMRIEGA